MTLKVSEESFLGQVTTLAELLGWQWVHFRPAKTAHGWRTPVSGPLGKGWPDLVLTRPRRLVFAELKSATGQTDTAQAYVLEALRRNLVPPAPFPGVHGPVCVHVWQPVDLTSGVAGCLNAR